MNKSLVYLNLIYFQNIPFLQSNLNTKTNINNFFNLKISKSFQTFYRDSTLFNLINIKQSKFSNFLQSSLIFSNQNLIKKDISIHTQVYGHKTHVCIFQCSFINCSSTTSHGGALFFDKQVTAAQIDRCAFLFCYSRKVGGAFYGMFNEFNLSRTCFNGCQSIDYGHSFFINLNFHEAKSIINQNTIFNSSRPTKLIGKSAVILMVGSYHFQATNFSSNSALSYSSTIGCLVVTNLSMSFSDFYNCTAPHLMRFYNTNVTILSFSNFVANIATTSLFFINGVNYLLHCSFYKNLFRTFISGFLENYTVAECYFDIPLFNVSSSYIYTYEIKYGKDPEFNLIPYLHKMECNVIYNETEDYYNYFLNHFKDIKEQDPILTLKDQVLYKFDIPTVQGEIINPFTKNIAPFPTKEPKRTPEPTSIEPLPKSKSISEIITPQDISSKTISIISKKTKTITTLAPITKQPKTRIEITSITPKIRTKRPKKKTINTVSSTSTFSSSPTFESTKTFIPSMQFTASVSPAQSLVPYVLYSAAGFVVFAVLTSFLFLKSSDTGYNLMTPSESADSRVSDYASSTSTTVTTMTGGGDSSSII